MIHTMNLTKEISYHEFHVLHNILYINCKNANKKIYKEPPTEKKSELTVCELYSQRGIIIKLGKNEHAKYAYIELRINPKRTIDTNNLIEVTKETDISNILSEFEMLLKPIQRQFILDLVEKKVIESPYKFEMLKGRAGDVVDLTDLGSYQVRRIDYCINVKTKLADTYMKLIRQGDVPPRFIMKMNNNSITGKSKRYKDSMYLHTKSRDIKINFYNKEKEVESKWSNYKDYQIKEATDMLRFEIQCSGAKVNNMKANYKLQSKSLGMFAYNQIALEVVNKYYNAVVGKEDYVTLQSARQCVIFSDLFTNTEKKRMIDVLELINQKRSIYEARIAYVKERKGSEDAKKAFNQVLRRIRMLYINPVTIPVNWGVERLSNLYDEILKAGALPGQEVVLFGLDERLS